MGRIIFLLASLLVIVINGVLAPVFPRIWYSMFFFGPVILVGLMDMFQQHHAIRRNFPIIGNFRYLLEFFRPEINQYFVESNTSGTPFNRLDRSLVYQRAKGQLDTLPFGTQKNVYEVGYEWVTHSIMPAHVDPASLRVVIGASRSKPYQASIFNIGAMSFGSLSKNAVMALNQGARMGGFAQNTGEGGLTSYHRQGGDLIWQVGTGYFGCRDHDGKFSPERFAENASLPEVKMIELKISQGAKPGHGGILPAEKVTEEIARFRGVEKGKSVISPPGHSAFSTPLELVGFIERLRELSGGKPVGFKICVGKPREFMAICKAMIKTGITPDFITVDGGEGGTGAAPLEFSNYVGSPLNEGLVFVHNALVGFALRGKVRIISSGKINSGFGIIKHMVMGADLCYSSRGMMLALGCIQALKCNTNHCPTGVATQDASLVRGLVVAQKNKRVANFHKATVKSFAEILGAMGFHEPKQLRPRHLMRRISLSQVKDYSEIYPFIEEGALLKDPIPPAFERSYRASCAETFEHV
ncbi:MAG: FMN-binding glutamate synthase family protein [Candidatus Omnitrophica bacterium]|nr:FMN-binding glutamate synthase family protein [Candidatus Omnitrophota bacterium]